MPSKVDTDLFIEAWEMDSALWNVNSEEYKNRNMRTKSLKKLTEQFNVLGSLVIFIIRWGTHLYMSHFPSVCPFVCRVPYLRNRTLSDHNFWYTYIKCYLQVFFSFF